MSDYISQELIDEIFTRLPIKSLLRFRSVSKSVCARISSPDFIRKHALQSQPKFLIRHRKDYYSIHSEEELPLRSSGGYNDETTLKFPYNDETTLKFPYRYTFNIVGSCNGIFCVYEKGLYGNYFSLWNRSIRRKLLLSDVPFCDSSCLCHGVTVGFGFDSVNDDYKIVWLSHSKFRQPPVCSFVYSMKTNAWCKIQVPSTPYSGVSSYACLFNGALYWIANCDSTRVDDIDRHYILTFDLSTHLFGKIVLPKPDWGINRLAIIKGSLAVFSTTYNNSGIWVREEHDNTCSWSVLYESNTVQFEKDKIFELRTTGDFLFHTYDRMPEVFNFETGVSKRLTERLLFSPKVDIEKFVETLELLGKGTSYEEKQLFFARSQKKKKKKTTSTWPF